MACYKPQLAAILKIKEKRKIVFLNSPEALKYRKTIEAEKNIITIGCGKCEGCKLSDAKEWAARCMLESQFHEHNETLTLTYNDKNLPHGINKTTGEIIPTLVRKDYEDFIKRLRIYWQRHGLPPFKEKYCGEYGDISNRPHYHAILFGLEVPDKVYHGKNENGYDMYTSKTIEKIWGKGFITLNEVNYETCAYVSRYVMKKAKIKSKDWYLNQGIEPEFTGQSNRPGIARGYYDLFKDKIYKTDEIFLNTAKGVQKVTPCRYFDKIRALEAPEQMAAIKEARILKASIKEDNELNQTDLNWREYLKVKEENKLRQIKQLKRAL